MLAEGLRAGRILRKPSLNGGIDLAGTVVTSSDPELEPGMRVVVNGCGLSETIEEVRASAWSAAITPDAKESYWSCDLSGSSSADGCIYHQGPGGLITLIAREGSPSPVPGRTWGPLESPSLAIPILARTSSLVSSLSMHRVKTWSPASAT